MSESGYSSDEDCFYREQLRAMRKLYKVKSLLKRAAHGDIFAGVKRATKEDVILKVVKKHKLQTTTDQGRKVPLEAKCHRLAAEADPAGTVSLYNTFERECDFVMVMEKPKNSLDMLDFINEYGQLDEKTTRQICRQLATSSLAHGSIIHGDLKDENVLFDPMSGATKIIDFGNANFVDHPNANDFGTPAFYAPEMKSNAVDIEKCTVYTIGCIAFTALTGSSPFGSGFDFHRHVLFNTSLLKSERHFLTTLLCPNPSKRISLSELVHL